jgi:hypothetical protein
LVKTNWVLPLRSVAALDFRKSNYEKISCGIDKRSMVFDDF